MNVRTYKRILFFLNDLENAIETPGNSKISKELIKHYTDSELREMIFWLYKDSWSKNALGFLQRNELIDLIQGDWEVLLWTIHSLEQKLTNFPNYSQKEVDNFFEKTQNQIHYLASKSVKSWDEYDTSNYRNLLVKTGTSKKVYGVFTADVLAEDVYAVTTEPTFLFDTIKDAEQEIEKILLEKKFTREELTTHSLWLLK